MNPRYRVHHVVSILETLRWNLKTPSTSVTLLAMGKLLLACSLCAIIPAGQSCQPLALHVLLDRCGCGCACSPCVLPLPASPFIDAGKLIIPACALQLLPPLQPLLTPRTPQNVILMHSINGA